MKTGWVKARLGDIAKTQYGLSESMNEDGNGFKIFRMGEVQNGQLVDTGRMKYADISGTEFEQYKLRAGDILFNRTNSFELVGKTGIFALEGDYCFASYLVRLSTDRRKVVPEFVNYFMNSGAFQKSVKGKASQSINQANINATILSNELICFPESLSEQRRIVGLLDQAFEAIATAKANTEKNLQNARALFESHLSVVFSQKGTDWVENQLDSLTEVESPITYGVVKPGDEGEVRFVRGGDLVRGKVRINYLRTITRAVSDQYRRTLLRGGELLICLVGQPGQVAVAPRELAGANIARQVGLIRLRSNMNAEYVRLFLQSPSGKEALGARESGSVQQVINLGELRHLRVPYPALNEQNRIVDKLDELATESQYLENIYQQKSTALDALKNSLLHQAFTGGL